MKNYFAKNLKFLREQNKLSQNKLGELTGVNQTTIARWENEEISPSIDNVVEISKVLQVSLPELLGNDLKIDNGKILDVSKEEIKIPILGRIPAGTPIEAIEEILGYEKIPAKWVRNGNKFFALLIDGDSMYPEYRTGDVIIVKQMADCISGQDCVVLVNGYDATFKRVIKEEDGIKLKPLNNDYETQKFNMENIVKYPVTILGVAKEVRRKL